jgi:hypothetical protein
MVRRRRTQTYGKSWYCLLTTTMVARQCPSVLTALQAQHSFRMINVQKALGVTFGFQSNSVLTCHYMRSLSGPIGGGI